MARNRKDPKAGEVWIHNKGGKYLIVGVAEDTTYDKLMVIYHLVGIPVVLYARELNEFMDPVALGKYRFTKEEP